MSNTYFFTEQGTPYVPVASYYNPDSYGESHYFFPAGSSTSEVGVETIWDFPVSAYASYEEIPGYFVGGFRGSAEGAFAGNTGAAAGMTDASYGGWIGSAGSFGTTFAVGFGIEGGDAGLGGSMSWGDGETSMISYSSTRRICMVHESYPAGFL